MLVSREIKLRKNHHFKNICLQFENHSGFRMNVSLYFLLPTFTNHFSEAFFSTEFLNIDCIIEIFQSDFIGIKFLLAFI